jgi:DNA-directed RNA polymerase specialized sigma24 family protein
MLGSPSEADDAVQEAWLRLSRADASGVENLAGWLTTVVARVCLNMLAARSSRPRVVFGFTIADGRIVEIELLADPERLRQHDLAILDD